MNAAGELETASPVDESAIQSVLWNSGELRMKRPWRLSSLYFVVSSRDSVIYLMGSVNKGGPVRRRAVRTDAP